jgi:hypothetical protein
MHFHGVMDQNLSPSEKQRTSPKQAIILLVLLGAQFMFALDFSIVTVALPAIGRDMAMSPSELSWIITLFALSAAGLMLLMGRIGDYYGRKKLFLLGMALLTVGSLIGGIAPSPEFVYTARILQGIATAVTAPSALALITTSFPEGRLRNKALSLNGAILSLGFGIGSALGGVLTDLLGWRFTFYINVPIGLLILLVAPFVIQDSSEPTKQKLDVPGAVAISAALFTLVFGISQVENANWSDIQVWGFLALSAVLLALFWIIEKNSTHPLATVQILRRPSVALGNLGGMATFSMESGKVFLLTIYLQQILATSPLLTGVAFAVLGTGAFLGGIAAAPVLNKIGPRNTLIIGLTIQAATTLTFLGLNDNPTIGYVWVMLATFIGGFGHVLAIVSYTAAVTSGLPDSEQGLATGLTTMTQQVGFTIGTPILAAIAAGTGVRANSSPDQILSGLHTGLVVDALILLSVVCLIFTFYKLPKEVTEDAQTA